jgi:hypothetical protein
MATDLSSKIPKKYNCEICYYYTHNLKDYTKHLSTLKHKKRDFSNVSQHLATISPQKSPTTKYVCDFCSKIYKDRTGLWRHNKKCKQHTTNTDNEIIKMLIQENTDFKYQVLEICKNIQTPTIISNNNTTNNKTFNLNLFLNDTCKDAMNIMDFINSIQLKLSDLENVGKFGYVDGISNIIVKNLKALDVSKRPVHCSDLKREILYVKDQDKWEKENEEKERLRKAIKYIAHKNVKMIPEWKEKNPEYIYDEGKQNDKYIQIISKSMGGSDKTEDETYHNKIISNLAKTVIIDKE